MDGVNGKLRATERNNKNSCKHLNAGTNELNTVREQGEQKKSSSSNVKEYLEIGGVLDYFSYSYHLCVLVHIYVSLASYKLQHM